jgi:toxin secretion/phage lysis holin
MRQYISGILALLVTLLGDFDKGLQILMIVLALDFFTGVILAGKRRELCEKVGFWGGIRKVCVLLAIILCVQIDVFLGVTMRDTVIYFFTFNEMLSVVKNLDGLGVPLPSVVTMVLKGAEHGKDSENQ